MGVMAREAVVFVRPVACRAGGVAGLAFFVEEVEVKAVYAM